MNCCGIRPINLITLAAILGLLTGKISLFEEKGAVRKVAVQPEVMPLNSQAQLQQKIARAGGGRGLVSCVLYEMSYKCMGLKGEYPRFV